MIESAFIRPFSSQLEISNPATGLRSIKPNRIFSTLLRLHACSPKPLHSNISSRSEPYPTYLLKSSAENFGCQSCRAVNIKDKTRQASERPYFPNVKIRLLTEFLSFLTIHNRKVYYEIAGFLGQTVKLLVDSETLNFY